MVAPGELTGVMGPSGGGKSTLLSIIGGRISKGMRVEGNISFNGRALDKAMKRQMGYVHQDDVLYEMLTVRETLYYAAMLKLPATMPAAQKLQRVETVVSILGLQKCVDTPIGGFLHRGVSGGERRRVSIGHELLVDPPLMLLDEPTSGLDSTTAMAVVRALRQVAAGGRSILLTIHQPSSRLYQQLDHLLLVAQGHLLYTGPAAAAAQYFGTLGHTLPYGMSTADWLLDLATGCTSPVADEAEGAAAVEKLWLVCEQQTALAMKDAGAATETIGRCHKQSAKVRHGILGDEVELMPGGSTACPQAAVDVLCTRGGASAPAPSGRRAGAGYRDQVRLLLARSAKVRRFESMNWQKAAQNAAMAALSAALWWRKGRRYAPESLSHAQDVVGLLYAELQFLSFFTMYQALHTFSQHYRMLVKERTSGMYRLSAIYLARTLSDLPVECAYPTAYVVLIYWLVGLRATASAFALHWAAMMSLVLIAQSLGVLIGTTILNLKNAQVLMSVVALILMLVGGYYIRAVPPWCAWIKYLSFYYWCFSLVLVAEYRGSTFKVCDSLAGACHVQSAKDALWLPANPDHEAWPAGVVVVGFLVGLRVAGYVLLRLRTARV